MTAPLPAIRTGIALDGGDGPRSAATDISLCRSTVTALCAAIREVVDKLALCFRGRAVCPRDGPSTGLRQTLARDIAIDPLSRCRCWCIDLLQPEFPNDRAARRGAFSRGSSRSFTHRHRWVGSLRYFSNSLGITPALMFSPTPFAICATACVRHMQEGLNKAPPFMRFDRL